LTKNNLFSWINTHFK